MDQIKKTMLVSPDDIKGSSYVNYNVDDSIVGPSIREAQEIHLQAVLGSNLLYRLQELVYNSIKNQEDNIDDDENALYKELLDDYVQPYLEMKTQAVICLPVSMKIRNYGVAKNSDTNIQSPTVKDVMVAQNRYNTMAAKYATRLSKYLCIHRDDFEELSQTECGCGVFVKPMIGKTFVETGLVLGDSDNGCGC